MSAPPIAITRWMPSRPAMRGHDRERHAGPRSALRSDERVRRATTRAQRPSRGSEVPRRAAAAACCGSSPRSLPNATIEPVKVIAPTKTPTKISISWISLLDPGQRRAVTEVAGEADQHRGEPDEAVQDRDQLGHRRHRHARGQHRADARRRSRRSRPRAGNRSRHCRCSAVAATASSMPDDAEDVAAPRRSPARSARPGSG